MRSFFSILFTSALFVTHSQSLQSGILPQLVFSASFHEKWDYTLKLESMQSLYLEGASRYDYVRTDIQNFLTYRLTPFSKIAGGYQYRFLDSGENSQRFIQQYAWVRRRRGFRLAHRLRADQTFTPSRVSTYRIRYRLSSEIPLNGATIDTREFYLVLSDELLASLESQRFDLENRIGIFLGNNLTNTRKVQVGLDLRIDRPDRYRGQFWWVLAYYSRF